MFMAGSRQHATARSLPVLYRPPSFTGRTPTIAKPKEILMTWTTPAFTDLRFGFEITMYIANR
jgi:pyrroloquinoline quinone biosynthesis protein A